MDVTNQVIRPAYLNKLLSVQQFREDYADGVTTQAIGYACRNGLIDYIQIDDRVKVIVLTEKTLAYSPNRNKNRRKRKKRRPTMMQT